MTVIFKYPLPMSGSAVVSMPIGARLLTVQNQRERLALWAVVDDEAREEDRRFHVLLTGHHCRDLKPGWLYVGTAQFDNGGYVVHVFGERAS